MVLAKVAAMLPDISLQPMGELDLAGAQQAFDTFPWAKHLRRAKEMEAAGDNCVNPDITFRIDRCHIVTTIGDNGADFELEVCVSRDRRLLDRVLGPKFYRIRGVTPARCKDALRIFFTHSASEQNSYFAELRRATP
jgi:hypothetical protein